MPGNTVVINGAKVLQWYVGDSKMNLLIGFLNAIGHKGKQEYQQREKCPNCEIPHPWKMTKVDDKGFCPDCGKKLGLHKESDECPNCEGSPNKAINLIKEDVFKCPDCNKPIMCTQQFVTVKEND